MTSEQLHWLMDGYDDMDESPLQLLKSENAPSSDHYMVVRAAGPPGKRIILYDYIPSRTKELLIDSDGTAYRGKLLTDGLERYDEICAELKLLIFPEIADTSLSDFIHRLELGW